MIICHQGESRVWKIFQHEGSQMQSFISANSVSKAIRHHSPCVVTVPFSTQEPLSTNFTVSRSSILLTLPSTAMRRLTTGIRSEKCVVRLFRRCANVIECTYTNLDSAVQPATHLGYMVQPIAPRLQTCTECYCTEHSRKL